MTFNGFDIDFTSLRRHRRPHSIPFKLTVAQQVVPPIDAESVRDLANQCNDYCRSQNPNNPVKGEGWIQLPDRNFAGVLNNTDDWDDALEWLETFTGSLGDGGAIRGGPTERWPRDPENPTKRTEPGVFCAYTRVPDAPPHSEWGGSPDLRRRLATQMANWVVMPRAKNYLQYESITPTHDTDLAEPLSEAINRVMHAAVIGEVKTRDTHRKRLAGTAVDGLTEHLWWDEQLTWTQKRADLEEALLFSPADLEYGFIGRTTGLGWAANFSPHWMATDWNDVFNQPGCLVTHVPDAFGIQVLTDRHLEQAPDLTHWQVISLPGGRHLVTHPRVDDWYASDTPPPQMLEQARRDFDRLILRSIFDDSTD